MKTNRLVVFFNSYTQGISGGDVCLLELIKRMNDYRLMIVTSKLGRDICQQSGLEADYLLTTKENVFTGVVRTYFKRIIKSVFLPLKIHRSDILYSSSDFLPDVIPAFIRRLANKDAKWVQKIFHIIPKDRPITYYAQRLSFFLIRRRADVVIVDNSLLKKQLIQRDFKTEKIKVNYPGIDLQRYQNYRSFANVSEAVFLGRFHYSKGLFDLVEIWRCVCERIPQARLSIIGNGNARIKDELKRKISEAGLENNVLLTGYLENEKMIETMKGSKVFVFPSHEEGFGIAILEALGCGLPVVAWDLPVYKEVFQHYIIQVRENDYRAFSESVIRLLEDGSMCSKISQAGSEYIKRYSWNSTLKRELELLEN